MILKSLDFPAKKSSNQEILKNRPILRLDPNWKPNEPLMYPLSSSGTHRAARKLTYAWQGDGAQRYSTYSSGGYDKRSSSSSVYDDKRGTDSRYHRNDERHSSTRSYVAPPPPRISEMAPPSRYQSTARGRSSQSTSNYRGRSSARARGNNYRARADIMARKRPLTTTLDYRRRLLTSRSRDYVQRVRMTTKLRRR